MITKLVIRDNSKCPVGWAYKVPSLGNGKEYEFKDGVNVIVGENGSGKTSLMEMIKRYLLVEYTECSRGKYNNNIHKVESKKNIDGVDLYGDYTKNTFRLCHAGEIQGEEALENFETIGTVMTQKSSSTGESVLVSINSLFKKMFSRGAKLTFDYDQFDGSEFYQDYADYIKGHRVDCPNSWTILMDEPDRNLSIGNIDQIESILSYNKPQTQLIVVIHNPLIIYSLAKKGCVNFIELTDGYVDKVVETVDRIVKEK